MREEKMDSNNMNQNQQSGESTTDNTQNGYYQYGNTQGNNTQNGYTQNTYTQGDNVQNGYTQNTYTQNGYSQNTYTNANYQQVPYNNGGYQPQYQPQTDLEEPVTMGEWAIAIILMMIPCVNIIMMFVWAFSSNTKKSKANFFKVYLIVMAVSLVLSMIFGTAIVNILSQYANYY